jgi:hypothetical protein
MREHHRAPGRQDGLQCVLQHRFCSDCGSYSGCLGGKTPSLMKYAQYGAQRGLFVFDSGARYQVGVQPRKVSFRKTPQGHVAAEKDFLKTDNRAACGVCIMFGDIRPKESTV